MGAMGTIAFIFIGIAVALIVFFVMLWSFRDRNKDSWWWQG